LKDSRYLFEYGLKRVTNYWVQVKRNQSPVAALG